MVVGIRATRTPNGQNAAQRAVCGLMSWTLGTQLMWIPLGVKDSARSPRPLATIVLCALMLLSALVAPSEERDLTALRGWTELVSYMASHPTLRSPPACADLLAGGGMVDGDSVPGDPREAARRCERVMSALNLTGWRRVAFVPSRGVVQLGSVGHVFVQRSFLIALLHAVFFLLLIGPWLEGAWGPKALVAVYLGTAVGGTFVVALAAPESLTPIAGASVALVGCTGAFMWYFAHNDARYLMLSPKGKRTQLAPAWTIGGFWLVVMAASLYRGQLDLHEAIGQAAGFACGVLMALGLEAADWVPARRTAAGPAPAGLVIMPPQMPTMTHGFGADFAGDGDGPAQGAATGTGEHGAFGEAAFGAPAFGAKTDASTADVQDNGAAGQRGAPSAGGHAQAWTVIEPATPPLADTALVSLDASGEDGNAVEAGSKALGDVDQQGQDDVTAMSAARGAAEATSTPDPVRSAARAATLGAPDTASRGAGARWRDTDDAPGDAPGDALDGALDGAPDKALDQAQTRALRTRPAARERRRPSAAAGVSASPRFDPLADLDFAPAARPELFSQPAKSAAMTNDAGVIPVAAVFDTTATPADAAAGSDAIAALLDAFGDAAAPAAQVVSTEAADAAASAPDWASPTPHLDGSARPALTLDTVFARAAGALQPDPAVPSPAVTDPVVADPVGADPVGADPVGADPVVAGRDAAAFDGVAPAPSSDDEAEGGTNEPADTEVPLAARGASELEQPTALESVKTPPTAAAGAAERRADVTHLADSGRTQAYGPDDVARAQRAIDAQRARVHEPDNAPTVLLTAGSAQQVSVARRVSGGFRVHFTEGGEGLLPLSAVRAVAIGLIPTEGNQRALMTVVLLARETRDELWRVPLAGVNLDALAAPDERPVATWRRFVDELASGAKAACLPASASWPGPPYPEFEDVASLEALIRSHMRRG